MVGEMPEQAGAVRRDFMGCSGFYGRQDDRIWKILSKCILLHFLLELWENAWRGKWGFVALPNPVPTGQKHLGEKSVGPVSSGCRSVPPEGL